MSGSRRASLLLGGMFSRRGGGGGGGSASLPAGKNFLDYPLGDIPGTMIKGVAENQTPQIIVPTDHGNGKTTNNRILRIEIPTSGVQCVGIPFASPIAIPSSGQLRISFLGASGQYPLVGSGDWRQNNGKMGFYRATEGTLLEKIANASIYTNQSHSYNTGCSQILKATDVADYTYRQGNVGWGCQPDLVAAHRWELDFDTGLWAWWQWQQHNGFFKFYGQTAAGKLAAWAAADGGAALEGFFIHNTSSANSYYDGSIDVGYVWVGTGDDDWPLYNTLAVPDSSGALFQ